MKIKIGSYKKMTSLRKREDEEVENDDKEIMWMQIQKKNFTRRRHSKCRSLTAERTQGQHAYSRRAQGRGRLRSVRRKQSTGGG